MVIPTGSMENTLLIGDALFVEKVSYGARVPFTPIGLPFAELIYRKAYLDQPRLPYMRLPGWRKLKQNDIVVFNFPMDSTFNAIDRRDPYVKRLVGMPGDVIEIDSSVLKVNGKVFQPKKDAKLQEHEENKISIREDAIYINGKPTDSYTVQQDYFWMMGDNRDQSLDARYFGFVPENHIMGRPVLL
ncbi:unnamed protein product, partial [Cyprideis torosa]